MVPLGKGDKQCAERCLLARGKEEGVGLRIELPNPSVRNTLSRRVAITGLGCITPLGVDVRTYWQSLLDGRSGVGPITLFDARRFPVPL